MMVYTIIPTHERLEHTKALVTCLEKAGKNQNITIIIIDDTTTYETYNYFYGKKNSIYVLKGNGNLWWGGSINYGIDYVFDKFNPSNDDLCIFANNDIKIDVINFNFLIQEMDRNKNQIIHPRTFDQNGNEVSSGAKIISWFPYITKHPRKFSERLAQVDLGTARFLMFSFETLRKVGGINKKLPHYHGDNYFTLKAKGICIKTFILRDSFCKLDNSETGLKNDNIKSFKSLIYSFFSIKSSNNIYNRYKFNKTHANSFLSVLITTSMTFNSIIKFFKKKFTI